jgi:hypothetical protein
MCKQVYKEKAMLEKLDRESRVNVQLLELGVEKFEALHRYVSVLALRVGCAGVSVSSTTTSFFYVLSYRSVCFL